MTTDRKQYDVAIAGAGPAGSSLAIRLAKAGLRVILTEQKAFPREKLCGEFISPECQIHFNELGVLPDIKAAGGTELKETVFFAQSGKGVAVESSWFGVPDSLALGLSRAEMDLILFDRAKAVGVDVRGETSVSGLDVEDGRVVGVTLRDKSGIECDIKANLTIDATGRTRSLARRLDPRNVTKTAAELVAFKTHLSDARLLPATCEIYVYRGGYGGCNRVENDLYNLCFIASAADARRLGSDPERVMREVVCSNKRAAIALSDAKVVKPWHAVPIERFGRGELVPAPGLIAIGDAAAFIDPFTGSGMLLAMESARIAAGVISNYIVKDLDLSVLEADYRSAYAAAFDLRLRACSVLRYAAFMPRMAAATIALLNLSRPLRRGVARATRFSAKPGA